MCDHFGLLRWTSTLQKRSAGNPQDRLLSWPQPASSAQEREVSGLLRQAANRAALKDPSPHWCAPAAHVTGTAAASRHRKPQGGLHGSASDCPETQQRAARSIITWQRNQRSVMGQICDSCRSVPFCRAALCRIARRALCSSAAAHGATAPMQSDSDNLARHQWAECPEVARQVYE